MCRAMAMDFEVLASNAAGLLINAATLALFWMALRRGGSHWDYDLAMVLVGEMVVVLVEALAIMWFVSRRLNQDPASIWFKCFTISFILNAISLIASIAFTKE